VIRKCKIKVLGYYIYKERARGMFYKLNTTLIMKTVRVNGYITDGGDICIMEDGSIIDLKLISKYKSRLIEELYELKNGQA
jgi:hypothetical protein